MLYILSCSPFPIPQVRSNGVGGCEKCFWFCAASIDRVSKLNLEKLPGAVQVLMDTKLFVKDYEDDLTVIPPRKAGDPRLVRLMCEVDIVPELPKGYKERYTV